MSIELKVKSKHLTAEAQIIRFEERKQKARNKEAFWSLRHHRTWDVRNENRATFLARAFLASVPYKVLEQKVHDPVKLEQVIVPRVVSMIKKYGSDNYTKQDVMAWINA